MTEWYARLASAQRISVTYWLLNALLAAGLLAFAVRGWAQ